MNVMQNCFFLLELPFTSPDIDEDVIREAISKKQSQWSRELNHPIKQAFAKECLKQLPTIRAIMLNHATRSEEASNAIRIKASKETALKTDIYRLKTEKANITANDVERLIKKYKQYGFTKEELVLSIQSLSGSLSENCDECTQEKSFIPQKKHAFVLSIGIDFGASFIKVAIADEEGIIEVVRDEDGMIRFPATVVYDNDGYVNVGDVIKDIDEGLLHRTCCFLRNSLWKTNLVDGYDVTKEAIGFVLKATVGLAEDYYRERHPCRYKQLVTEVIVCYPSWFTKSEKAIFAEACKNSDVNVVGLLDETTAIATSYDVVTGNEGRHFLVFDLGFSSLFVGRIFTKDHSVVLEQYEDCDIAGKLWTESILRYLLEQLELCEDNIELATLNYLQDKAGQVKEALSNTHTTAVHIELPDVNKTVTLSREHFETLTKPYIEKAIHITKRVAGNTPIYQILLAGGDVNMPRVRDALENALGVEVRKIRPDSAVSIGALLHHKKSITERGD